MERDASIKEESACYECPLKHICKDRDDIGSKIIEIRKNHPYLHLSTWCDYRDMVSAKSKAENPI